MPTKRNVVDLLLRPTMILALVWAYGLVTRSDSIEGGGAAIVGVAIGLLILVPLIALWSKVSHQRDDDRLDAQFTD